ncbi:MAG TPA: cation:proton antiporter [Gaiella sp.]|jgi:Kef-type K+ transport system membrane component KefB
MSALLVGESAQVVTSHQLQSLVFVLAASAAAAFLARIGPRLVLPTVVVEIVLGIVLGPQVLDWASEGTYIEFLANFGLALLFFFAGLEVIEKHVPRQAIVRGSLGWTISIALGIGIGYLLQLAGLGAEGWLLGLAVSTTALGTLVPILSDSGILPTPLGTAVLGTGVAGEFWPITVMSVFLTGVYGAGAELVLLVVFGAITIGTAFFAMRARPPRVVAIIRETLHSTGQAAVRLSIALIAALVLLAHDVGFDFVLGAFAAGLIVGLVLDNPEGGVVRMRLEGIGFGFLIPIYFVATGLTFDLDSLLTASGLALAAFFLVLLLVVRGTPALLWLRDLGPRGTASVAFFGATQLPLVVAIVGIGRGRGAIDGDVAASLIGAAMVSVLAYPLIAGAISGAEEEWVPDSVASTEAEY